MSIDFSQKPVLIGDLVTLRPADRADAVALSEGMADPEVTRLTGSAHSSAAVAAPGWTVSELAEIYQRWSLAADRIVWVIIDNATGRVVGESVLNELDAGNRSCGFRIWIAGARDRGLGTEAIELTLRHGFAQQGLNRIELEVFAFNPRARHVYAKVGFVLEGTKRQALRYDDGWIDAHSMAMLAEDWHRRHGRPDVNREPAR